MAQLRADEIRQKAPFVDMIVGTAHVAQVGALLEEAVQKRRLAMRLDLPERKGAIVTDIPARKVDRAPKLKAFVPIQYGCDKFCTFCIVPLTRGRERSRPTADIVEEVRRLAERGTKEITLLGQTVNSYGKNLLEGRVPFARLLKLLNDIDGIERIRFTSPYPRDFRDDLISAIAELPKVMEHVHLPLQSGDNDILKAMHRLYTVEQFEEVAAKLRERVPGIAITTDIIVGFPGETDEQFENTLRVVERVRFDGAFMFAYSPRPGTPAAQMENQVPRAVKQERLQRLIALQNRITCEINSAQVGQVFEVLVEGPSQKDPTKLAGFTRENKMMHFVGARELAGQIVRVRADEAHLWGFYGTLV
jgi:tRNA-2-methylthio-N6-dimethylallyladenosine synthase